MIVKLQTTETSAREVTTCSPYRKEAVFMVFRTAPELIPAKTGTSMRAERPDHVVSAELTGDNQIFICFADGRTGTVSFESLEIDPSLLNLTSLRASSWGSSVEIQDHEGHTVDIDSAVLRAYIDPAYAKYLTSLIDG